MAYKTTGREFHPVVLELARGQNFVALSTLLPDGRRMVGSNREALTKALGS